MLSFKNISFAYGEVGVISQLDLDIEEGSITCLLGPSGCGKSTLLRLAAGLESLQSGCINLDQQILASPEFSPPPEKRPVGLMFQENALFPHMSVFENIAFGLHGQSQSEKTARVNELLEMVGLLKYAERYPHELSGGQQQRIALARCIAPQPKVLLMDEPYASIDITLRRSLREAARHTLKKNNATTILVTHDPPEAMEMADIIAVMDNGKIVQKGTPEEVYLNPAAASVAKLFGDAQSFEAEFLGDSFRTSYGEIMVTCDFQISQGPCELVARPNGLSIKKQHESKLKITDLRYIGDVWVAFLLPEDLDHGLEPLRVAVTDLEDLEVGQSVGIYAEETGIFGFEFND